MVGSKHYSQNQMATENLEGANEPLDANVVHVNSVELNSVESIALDTCTTPLLASSAASLVGYSTPLTPIFLELPSMAPAESLPKRQRSFSEFTRLSSNSFCKIEGTNSELHRLWDAFDDALFDDAVDVKKDNSLQLTDQDTSNKHDPPLIVRIQNVNSLQKSKVAASIPKNKPNSKSEKPAKQAKALKGPKKIKSLPLMAIKSEKTEKNLKRIKSEVLTPKSHKLLKMTTSDLPASPTSTSSLALPKLPATQSQSADPYPAHIRKQKVMRYLEKRKHRVWKKEIKYSCRKQFAETRPRVAGRFIPKNKLEGSPNSSSSNTPLQVWAASNAPIGGALDVA